MKRLCTCLISMAISRKSGNQSKYSVQQYLYNLCVRNNEVDNVVNLYRISVESCQFSFIVFLASIRNSLI